MKWQKIETAPKDGTKVLVYNAGWGMAPIARWGEYPGNPVLDENEEDVYMWGWVFDDNFITLGEDDGFVGWEDDFMPTHWSEPPE